MSADPEFANAVRAGIRARNVVPCFAPSTDISLLQLLSRDHVQRTGLFNRSGLILANIGHSPDTLIYFVREVLRQEQQAQELQEMVDAVAEGSLMPFSVERTALTRLGLGFNFNRLDRNFASVGLRTTSDVSWNLTFGDGPVTKASVSPMRLRHFLDGCAVHKHPVMQNYMGWVTAVYYVTGGLTYTGNVANVANLGVQLDPAPAGFDITDHPSGEMSSFHKPILIHGLSPLSLWTSEESGCDDGVSKQTNTDEWIIAVQFLEFE